MRGDVGDFLAWLERAGVASIAEVSSLPVAAYVEELTRWRSAPSTKQRLAAIRMLLGWRATGGVFPYFASRSRLHLALRWVLHNSRNLSVCVGDVMGLFARLMQPATSRYCLPYSGNNLMMEHVLDTTTRFVGQLENTRITKEQKLSATIAVLVVSMHQLTNLFKGADASKFFDFTDVTCELMSASKGVSIDFDKMYWHPQQAEYVRSALAGLKPDAVAKMGNAAIAVAMVEFNKQFFRDYLEEKGIDANSMEYTNSALCFVLNCMKDNSDDYLLMQTLGHVMSTHFMTSSIVLSAIRDRNGKQQPLMI